MTKRDTEDQNGNDHTTFGSDEYDVEFEEYPEEPERCDYCGISFIHADIYRCRNPYTEQVKRSCCIELCHICYDCCTERIKERDPICLEDECEHFDDNYLDLRSEELKQFFKELNLEFSFGDDFIFRSKNSDWDWEYHIRELPETITPAELKKIDESDIFMEEFTLGEPVILKIKKTDQDFGVESETLYKFNGPHKKPTQVFINIKETQEDGEPLIQQDLILEYHVDDYFPPEYLITTMYIYPTKSKKQGILVYIIYATRDVDRFLIHSIAKQLKEYPEILDVLYWEENMDDDIYEYMDENLEHCDIFLMFCSQNAQSKPIKLEWRNALKKGKKIIPIFEDENDIPNLLNTSLGIRFERDDLKGTMKRIHKLILKKYRSYK